MNSKEKIEKITNKKEAKKRETIMNESQIRRKNEWKIGKQKKNED